MSALSAYVSAIGVLGPGLADWPTTRAILLGEQPYSSAPAVLPPPEALAPTERRRTGRVVKLALAVGSEAFRQCAADPKNVPVVFASSGGDGDNCDSICRTLASDNRALSPTRFHNSVHNAPAGYWSIAAAAQVPTTTLCAYDGSFAAGLLEAMTQVATSGTETALIAYDLDYPPPLDATRPVPAPFGVALLLRPAGGAAGLARLTLKLGAAEATGVRHPGLAALAAKIPAARALPLLEAIARNESTSVEISYLAPLSLSLKVAPCG